VAKRDNSMHYRPDPSAHTRAQEEFQVFLARVLTVDYERKVCTLEDFRTTRTFVNVSVLPANSSSFESTDVQMPEPGATCLAVPLIWDGGFAQVAIISYVALDTIRAQDAIAIRGPEEVGGYQERRRGTYRKAYPGQKTVSSKNGYSEKIDDGWDRSARDLSRDKVDTARHSWTQMTGRRVSYTDAGLTFEGPINRPDAATIRPRVLPDGSKEFVVYLDPNAKLEDRYVSNKQDVIPFVEHTKRIQEYSLDYPLPLEVLETDLLDFALGTVADPWKRTTVQTQGGISYDNEADLIDQAADHPTSRKLQAVGPTTGEGPTPARRAFILERSEGTLVGYNRFDQGTYGQVLKPTLFPYRKSGRFGANTESGYLPVNDSTDHVEARLAASALAVRFPHEYNTTRWDVTKEGMLSFEVGATLPKENIPLAGDYEHPHGAGRSMEGHLVGSLKLVIGKNRDEEDAADIQALGQVVLRLGADDSSLPDARRTVLTQTRSQGDTLQTRHLQYWSAAKLKPGDSGDLENKTGAENVSLRAAFDGAAVLRLGARNPSALRRHLINGYQDGPGKNPYAVGDTGRIDSHSTGRPSYGAGDSLYSFHDLSQVGEPQVGMLPYNWSGSPVSNPDRHGLSLDVHAVRDILLRIGSNPDSGQSLLMDLAGGIVAALGKDNQGRSITAALDGGAELTIGTNAEGKGLRLEIRGDVDWTVKGNFHMHVTGDTIWESATHRAIAKTDYIVSAQKVLEVALTRHTTEAPDIVHNQGFYESDENS
jgi:hypothetical protein